MRYMLRVVFMGTPQFAVPALEALGASGDSVIAVVTQPDRPKGRGQKIQSPPVKVVAERDRIPVFQPEKIRKNLEFLESLKKLKPDLIVVAAYGMILPKEILDLARFGCINIHPSLLPKYRGAAPIPWAILNGDAKTGVTIMKLNEQMDAGDILMQKEEAIFPNDTTSTLEERLSKLGAQMLIETIQLLKMGKLVPVPQDSSKAVIIPLLKKGDGKIDWSESTEKIIRKVRAFNPWPGAYTPFEGKLCKIWKAKFGDTILISNQNKHCVPRGGPGVVLSTAGDLLHVATPDGVVAIEELQLEGGRRMSAKDFLRGHPIPSGMVFGQDSS
ncbi:MAG: methionyl-tRNA formyltransferase [Deltaproteobacteria bacterium]|nr:methionyl-tRNA formyltransferase [Deltaproteobacteria bacterium]